MSLKKLVFFLMTCCEEYCECTNNECPVMITGSFCITKDPVTCTPLLVGEWTSLKNVEITVQRSHLTRIEEDSGYTYFVFEDQEKGVQCIDQERNGK